MAGYIFSLDNESSLSAYATEGVYGTKKLTPSTGSLWMTHHEGTFADFATMQGGDNIYFFIRRKIYGIGKLVAGHSDCKFFNFPNAGAPKATKYSAVKPQLLWDEGEISCGQRCICMFEPDPHFFRLGIDIDDVLSSNPTAFRMLRVFWKLSFIKFDDDENQAFRDIILKRNQAAISKPTPANVFDCKLCHTTVASKLSPSYNFGAGISAILTSCSLGNQLKHEMALEAGILHQLFIRDANTVNVFGTWDYLSHQVAASPFKPVDYMDKMDLFGYAYLTGFRPTKSRFLVGELKKDSATTQDVEQLMKYVDWVKDEYCHGDYDMIHAFLVAHEFDTSVIKLAKSVGMRKYSVGMRPTQSFEWHNLKLVRYSFNATSSQLEFSVIT